MLEVSILRRAGKEAYGRSIAARKEAARDLVSTLEPCPWTLVESASVRERTDAPSGAAATSSDHGPFLERL